MKKIRTFIVWTLIFVGLLLAFDLLMVRSTSFPSWLAGVQRFYVDFRGRILNLTTAAPSTSIEQVIETTARPGAQQKTGTTPTARQRYVYADAQGLLHFADSLAEVPAAYRSVAQPLQD
jgi:hypothetical protein